MPFAADISGAREQFLDEVLASYLKAAQEGQAPSRQTLLDNHPELVSELAAFFADQDHVERLAAPLRAIMPSAPTLTAGAMLGDYELLDEIARGGMGVVYRARQKSLQRIVALKVLQAGPLASPEQAQRFQAEAEAIASLDHPNIVPIYEVGVHEGLPYFSMKLFEGGSLAKAIGDRRSAIGEKESARLLATVADAVQYAHERGILHRDLKPANILLDAQRQPHVSDFGLAKRTETARTAMELTLSGAIVGTPSYMAPEQATPSHGALTTAADVYGLGAILYELLTGRPPCKGDDLFDTLRRLCEEEPQPPRSLNPRVDRDLETICLKCLQKEPVRRYAGARELAGDLRRYLAGEPIEARPVGRLERLGRWCRRRPIAAGVVAAFVVVIVAAFVLVDRARRDARDNAQAKDEANDGLAKSRDKGRRMIDDICVRLSTDGWSEDPGTHERRKKLLEMALRYYRDFLDDPQAEAPARGELVRTYFRIGDVANALGKPDEALDAFERGRAAAEIVLQLRPDDSAVHTDLARIHNRIGGLHEKAGRADAALASCTRAYELLAALRRETPEDVAIVGELAVSCNNLGRLHYQRSQFDAARARYRECIDLNRNLIRRSSDLQYPYALAVTLDNYALLVSGQGQRDEAWRCFDEANQLLRRIVAAEPHVPRYRQQLGRNLHNRGNKQRGEKRSADAVKSLKEGCDVLTRLVEMQPRIRWYQEDLARSLHLLGHAYADLGAGDKEQLVPAIEAYRSAGEVYRRLATADPRSADPIYHRACCLFDGAVLLAKRKQTDEMLRAYRQARDLDRRLVQAVPDHLDYRKALGMTLNNLGHELWLLKQSDEALAALREALEHNRFALARTRNRSFHRLVLNTTYVFLGEVYRDTGQRDEWAALLRERRALWPDNAGELAVIACDLARARADDEAVRTLEQAVGQGFRDAARLEREPALTGLRQRPDFRKLLREMKEKARPKNGT